MKKLQKLKISEDEYNKYPAYTYKMLKYFKQYGYEKLDRLYQMDVDENPKYSLKDYILYFLENGETGFNTRFMTISITCSDTIKKIIENIFIETVNGEHHNDAKKILSIDDVKDDIINKIAKDNEYFVNERYDNTRADKVRKEGGNYFKDLINAFNNNKKIISQQNYDDTIKCGNILRDFINKNIKINNDIEIQYNLYIVTKGYPECDISHDLKYRFNILAFNNKTKEVTPYSIKITDMCEFNFYKTFIFNYDYFEADLATYILEKIIRSSEYDGYKINPMIFIPINTKLLHPMLWKFEVSGDNVSILYDMYVYEDIRNIINEIIYAQQHGGIPKQFKDDICYNIVDNLFTRHKYSKK
jgi:hypothetical protein